MCLFKVVLQVANIGFRGLSIGIVKLSLFFKKEKEGW
jgi:uncharacterized protein YjiK